MFKTPQYQLLVLVYLLFSSCVFKELKDSRNNLEECRHTLKITEERQHYDNINTSKQHQSIIDSLENIINQLKANTPEALRIKIDSISQKYHFADSVNIQTQESILATQDSINQLKKHLKSLYEIKGNKAVSIQTQEGTYHCYVADIRTSDITFHWQSKEKRPLKSLAALEDQIIEECKTMVFATNAGMYNKQNAPQGLFIQQGKELRPIDRRKEEYGNFYMQPNGIFLIDSNSEASIITTDDFDTTHIKQVAYATQSGPMVLIDGKVNKLFNPRSKNRRIRSGVGIINKYKVVFIISNQVVRFYDFAIIFNKYFNCQSALYLDGTISQMYLPEIGRFQKGGNFGPMIGISK